MGKDKKWISGFKKLNVAKNIMLTSLMLTISKVTLAAVDGWVFWDDQWEKIKSWDIWFEDIPVFITNAIDFLMWIAATVAIIFIIIWAYKILFGSISQDKTKWRDTILMAIWGFVIASLAWFIVKLILDNFS